MSDINNSSNSGQLAFDPRIWAIVERAYRWLDLFRSRIKDFLLELCINLQCGAGRIDIDSFCEGVVSACVPMKRGEHVRVVQTNHGGDSQRKSLTRRPPFLFSKVLGHLEVLLDGRQRFLRGFFQRRVISAVGFRLEGGHRLFMAI